MDTEESMELDKSIDEDAKKVIPEIPNNTRALAAAHAFQNQIFYDVDVYQATFSRYANESVANYSELDQKVVATKICAVIFIDQPWDQERMYHIKLQLSKFKKASFSIGVTTDRTLDFCKSRFSDTNRNIIDICYKGNKFVQARVNIPGRNVV